MMIEAILESAKSFIGRGANQEHIGVMRTVVSALVAHGHSVSVGLCQGYSAVLLPQLSSPDSDLGVISGEAASWLAGLGVISNPLGALIGGTLAELFGRRMTLLIAAFPYVVGWLLISVSTDLYWLGAGRFVTGFAVGLGSVSYVYVAEVSSPELRGVLAATGPVLVSLGVLLVYSLGATLPWRLVALLSAAIALCTGIMTFSLPESPPWLVSHNKDDKARAALTWLRQCPDKAAAEVENIRSKELENQRDQNEKFSFKSLVSTTLQPCVWKPFFILVAFFLFQEGSGIYIILFYAVDFVREVGTGAAHESVVSIGVGLARLLMSIVGAFLLCKFPRKSLAVTSALLMTLAMAAMAAYEFLFSSFEPEDRVWSWFPTAGVVAHVCVSMLGMLQLPWIMTSELFPLRVRSVAVGLVTALAHMMIFASVKTYPGLLRTIGLPATLTIFTIASLCGAVFAKFILPETKDKSLAEIESDFVAPKEKLHHCNFEVFTIHDCSVKLRTMKFNNV